MEHENHSKDWEKIRTCTARFCPKCSLEKIKVELKQYPSHLLGWGRCQSVFKLVGNNLNSDSNIGEKYCLIKKS
jgi:hypothetical protein